MTSREYFEGVADAVRAIVGCRARVEALRARDASLGSPTSGERVSGGDGPRDPRDVTAERMDAERRARRELAQLEAAVAEGRRRCAQVRARNPSHAQWGDVLELRYCGLLGVADIAARMCVGQTTVKRWLSVALDWCDHAMFDPA